MTASRKQWPARADLPASVNLRVHPQLYNFTLSEWCMQSHPAGRREGLAIRKQQLGEGRSCTKTHKHLDLGNFEVTRLASIEQW